MHDWKLIMQERSYKVQLSAALEQAAAESEARAKAEQKAKEDKEEMARKMLKAGMAPDTVAEISGIPAKELLSLAMPQTSKDETLEKTASASPPALLDTQAAEEAAAAIALEKIPYACIQNVSNLMPAARNGKVVAVVESDSDIVFVQQLAGDKNLGVVYHIDSKDIPPGLNLTLGANLSITKASDGNISIKTREERGQNRDEGIER
jgi:hypothetical protein